MVLPWMLAAVLPRALVPQPMQVKTDVAVYDSLPYRANELGAAARPDATTWLRLRQARRALIALSTGSCLVLCACLDLVLVFPNWDGRLAPSLIPKVNAVALLDLLFATVIVVAYGRASRVNS